MKFLKELTFLACLATLSIGQAQSKEITVGSKKETLSPVENRYAFVIGIDKYQDTLIKNFTSCRIDAVEFKSYLRSNRGWNMEPNHITQLLDVSKDSIVNSLTRFLDDISNPETATVYFYFSGHGVRGSIVPADCFTNEPEKLISYDYIKSEIDKRGVQSKVFILDACYSGSIIKMKGDEDFNSNYTSFIQDGNPNSNQVTFTATSRNRTTPAGKNLSVFTYHFLKTLEDRNTDTNNNDIVSSGELYSALKKKLATSNPPQFAGSREFPMASFKSYNPTVSQPIESSNDIITNITPKEENKSAWRDKYDYVMSFGEGFSIHRNGFIGYANSKGKEIVPAIYKGFTEPFNGFSVVSKDLVRYGAVDINGKVIVPLDYDEIDGFGDGLFALKKDGQWGFINAQLETIIPFKFKQARIFNCGVAPVKNDDGWGYINLKNEIVIPHSFDNAFDCQVEGLLPVNKDGKWGLISIDKTEKVPFVFDELKEFSEGLAAVKQYKKWGFINTYGKVVIQYKYDEAYFFENNVAEVKLDNKTYYINRAGICVKDCD